MPLVLVWIVVILRQNYPPLGGYLTAANTAECTFGARLGVSMLPQFGVSYYTWLVDDSFEGVGTSRG